MAREKIFTFCFVTEMLMKIIKILCGSTVEQIVSLGADFEAYAKKKAKRVSII